MAQQDAVYLSYLRRQEELAYQNHWAKKVDDLEKQLSNTITEKQYYLRSNKYYFV